MWSVDSACPEFQLKTAGAAIGSRELRGTWVALLRCGHPGVTRCAAWIRRLDLLGERLAELDCRLLVGLVQPDEECRALLASGHYWRQSRVTVGQWEAEDALPPGSTLLAVIDPSGRIRALQWTEAWMPLRGGALIEAVEHAQGHTPPGGPGGTTRGASVRMTHTAAGCIHGSQTSHHDALAYPPC